jgi:hypothetical protein
MLENFKSRLQSRIERNAVKVNLNWTDTEGNVHDEEVILKRSRVPLIGDWARIYPPVSESGSINWTNTIFGGRKNFIKLLIVLGIVGFTFLAFKDIAIAYETLRNLPCVQSCITPIVP